MFAFVIITHITTTIVQAKNSVEAAYPTKRNLFAEEDEVDFFSCCGVETFEFVVPLKKYKSEHNNPCRSLGSAMWIKLNVFITSDTELFVQ